MKLLKTLFYIVCIASVVSWVYLYRTQDTEVITEVKITMIDKTSPPCLQMYFNIEKYAKEYGVPRDFAFGIAYEETRYEGPFDWTYDHSQVSPMGAKGPMQIMLATAKQMWPGKKITDEMLLNDIEFNVKTSMKLLRHLKNTYGSWSLAFGSYNTGTPCVNGYAQKVASFKPNAVHKTWFHYI